MTESKTSQPGSMNSALVLRTTPPRAPRHLLVRSRLGLDDETLRDRVVMVVHAPPGFGKTSLLGQWRREFLARGAAVAWLTSDQADDAEYFLHALTLAVRFGCGRPGFGRFLLEGGITAHGKLEGVTAWLADVAQTALDMVLIVDDAERLAPRNQEALIYLLHNLPPNLRVVVGTRRGFDESLADLAASGQGITIGADMLRFSFDEMIAFMRNRFGSKVDADTCARLHDVADGWPLGVQLLLAAVEGSADPRSAIVAMLARSEWRGEHLVGGLIDNLAAADRDFLVRVSVVDTLYPDLCRCLTESDEAPERLARLVRDTPIFGVGDNSEWCRLHALARDALRLRLEALPEKERQALHARAMRWMAERGMMREAARHARAAGQREAALDLAEQCLYDAVTQGYQGTVLEMLEDVSEAELDQHPRLRLAAAWALALSERQEEAGRLVARILEAPAVDTGLRYECALILTGAAYFADEPDRCVEIFEPWRESPPLSSPQLAQMHANRVAIIDILRGDTGQARRTLQQAPRGQIGKGLAYMQGWVDYIVGVSYILEGQLLLCEETMRPALLRSEAELGRRHPVTCMLAAFLATSIYERDCIDDAAAVLANRLDVLERVGTPSAVLFGYRTAARIAAAQGAEQRALDLLEALNLVGVARHLPRLCIASLAEQTRIHAGKFRPETCRVLAARIDEIIAQDARPPDSLWYRLVVIFQTLSHANAAIAAQNWEEALAVLEPAARLADGMRLGRLRLEIMALRAFVLERKGEDGRPLLLEAINLAQTFGLARTFADAHPILADWVRRLTEETAGGAEQGVTPAPRAVHPKPAHGLSAPRVVPSMVLTPKEREVLELLARKLSNKEIAQAMSVGEETVKWHMKNLFGKLDAGTRKHVVRRAQVLGLLVGTE
ncbi:MAG: LuxR family transcriptional regulator [Betaproteobacteria bacterium]|nr:LuxR family transcriptional regulator [Betaproteobacteria bacterium]